MPKPRQAATSLLLLRHRLSFSDSSRPVIYGKSVMADANCPAYEAMPTPVQTAYNVAIADFFNAPNIQLIDISAYTGAIGSTIKVRVADDFKVASVHLKIGNADSSLVEEGNAVIGTNGWVYSATVANASLSDDKITVMASDQPANTSSLDRVPPAHGRSLVELYLCRRYQW